MIPRYVICIIAFAIAFALCAMCFAVTVASKRSGLRGPFVISVVAGVLNLSLAVFELVRP